MMEMLSSVLSHMVATSHVRLLITLDVPDTTEKLCVLSNLELN